MTTIRFHWSRTTMRWWAEFSFVFLNFFIVFWKINAIELLLIELNQIKFVQDSETFQPVQKWLRQLKSRSVTAWFKVFEWKGCLVYFVYFNLTKIEQLFISETVIEDSELLNDGENLFFLNTMHMPSFLNFSSAYRVFYPLKNFFLLDFTRLLFRLFSLFLLSILINFLFAPFLFLFIFNFWNFNFQTVYILSIGLIYSQKSIFNDKTQDEFEVLPILNERMIYGLNKCLFSCLRVQHQHAHGLTSLQGKSDILFICLSNFAFKEGTLGIYTYILANLN